MLVGPRTHRGLVASSLSVSLFPCFLLLKLSRDFRYLQKLALKSTKRFHREIISRPACSGVGSYWPHSTCNA